MTIQAFLFATLLAAGPSTAAKGPPLVDGVYVDVGACPGEGCNLTTPIQAIEPVTLYDKPSASPRAIGRVAKDEWVTPVGSQMRLTPLRGVVRKVQGQGRELRPGETVYLLTSQGEGCYDVWRRGATITWCDPEAMGADYARIAWSKRPANAPANAFWIRVKRAGGQSGWIQDAGDFRCVDSLAGDECPAPAK